MESARRSIGPPLLGWLAASAGAGLILGLSGGWTDWASMRSSAGLTTLVIFAAGVPLALAFAWFGDVAERVGRLISGGPGQGALQLIWLLIFAGIGGGIFWGVQTLTARTLDLSVDVSQAAGVIGGLGVGWLLHHLVRRIRPSVPSLGPVLLSVLFAAAAIWLWAGPLLRILPGFQPYFLAPVGILVGVAVVQIGAKAQRALIGAGAIAALGLISLPIIGDAGAAARSRVGNASLLTVRFFADRDGDGFAAAFDGGDCDDSDPLVHPRAVEIVGNDRDDNCRAGDLAVAPALIKDVPARGDGPPLDVVIISIDTLRGDAFTKALMPNLTAFAEGGHRFERAYAPSSFTDLSLRGVFTGWYASDGDLSGRFIGSDRPIADILAGLGWATFALHSLDHAGDMVTLGFKQAHDGWKSLHKFRDGSSAPQITHTALQLLHAPAPMPRLAWVHYLEPHHLYVPHAGFEHLGDDAEGTYRQEVAFVDQQMKPLLAWLSTPEVAAKTVVIVLSDHGEYQGELGLRGHGYTLYEAVTRVPLVVRAPGLSPKTIDTPVSLVDVFPTIIDLLGIRGMAPRSGHSLLKPEPRLLFAETRSTGDQEAAVSIRDGQWLLHCDEISMYCGLFDVIADPTCAQDLVLAHPDRVETMREALDTHLDSLRNDVHYKQRFAAWVERWGKTGMGKDLPGAITPRAR